MTAFTVNNIDIIHLLINKNPNVNHRNNDGYTVLDIAIENK